MKMWRIHIRDVRFYLFIVCSHVSRCACGVWWACDVMRNVCLLVGPSQGVNPANQGTFVRVCMCACVQLSFPNVLGYEEIQVHDSNQTQHLSCCYLLVSLSFALIRIFSSWSANANGCFSLRAGVSGSFTFFLPFCDTHKKHTCTLLILTGHLFLFLHIV